MAQLALFYRNGPLSPGLVILGRLYHDADVERLATADRITIEPCPDLDRDRFATGASARLHPPLSVLQGETP